MVFSTMPIIYCSSVFLLLAAVVWSVVRKKSFFRSKIFSILSVCDGVFINIFITIVIYPALLLVIFKVRTQSESRRVWRWQRFVIAGEVDENDSDDEKEGLWQERRLSKKTILFCNDLGARRKNYQQIRVALGDVATDDIAR